jgi:hypothetical protein
MLSKPASIKFNTDEVAWITSFEPKIEDAEGNPLLNELVHSIILVNHGEANVLCTTKQVGNPFAAATSLMNAIDLPEGYGYPVLPSDQLEAVAILKNPTSEKLQNVYIKIILRGKKNDGTAHFSDVRPLMMDVDPCEHKPMSIPPEKFVEKTMTGLVPDDGNIVAAHGFLQDYGVSASLTVNGEKEPFWQGIAEIDDEYHITALDHYEDAAGVPVKRGDELKFSIVYDNSGDGWYDEATGAAIVYLAADGAEKEIAATSGEDGETAAVPAADAQKAIIK